MMPKSRSEILRTTLVESLKRMLTILIGVAIGLPLLLALMQNSLIFYPQPASAVSPRNHGPLVEKVQVPVADGLALSGWLVRAPAAEPVTPAPAGISTTARAPLAIYFGGNAEEVSWMVDEAPRFAPWSLLLVNYRGYGGNPGAPGERVLFDDALALYDWAAARPDVDAGRIAVIGRSLGSGVAVHVAAERKVAGVVLVTPFDSLRAVAQGIYPLVPMSLLLRHPFDSLARATALDSPMLALVAAQDSIIPPKHARRLFDAWRGPKLWREFPADHNSIDSDPGYWDAVAAFLKAREAR